MASMKFLAIVACTAVLASSAYAQQTQRLRGTIEKVDGNTLTIKGPDGAAATLKLTDKALVVDVVKATLADIKEGAYIGSGKCCRSRTAPRRRSKCTPRNKSLFLDRGHAYVYRAYGLHFLANVSSEVRGVGAGVLLRALEPLDGIHLMRLRRPHASLIDLARGPGRLTEAMGIGPQHDGMDLCAAGPLWLGDAVRPAGEIGTSVRIGISRETQRLLRFYEKGSPYVRTQAVESLRVGSTGHFGAEPAV